MQARIFPLLAMFFALAYGQRAHAAKPVLDPEAEAFLQKVATFHQGLQSATTEVTLRILQSLPGTPAEDDVIKSRFAIARPNLFALRIEPSPPKDGRPGGGIDYVSDSHTIWTHLPELKQFTVDDAPATLDLLLTRGGAGTMALSQMGPVAELFRRDPLPALLRGVSSLHLGAVEQVDGVDCIVVTGEQEEMDWRAYFEKGEKPVLRRFSFSPLKGMLAHAPEEMKEQLKGAKVDVTVDFSPWILDAKLATETFAFNPPKEARKVVAFTADEAAAPAGSPPEPAEALAGQPAPDFGLALHGGGKMQLSAHKGKEIVILDFWATWCGPCVRAMPIVNEVAAAFKDKGVVLYAVNQQEEEAVIKKFLEAKKLELNVALDAQGAAAKLYRVTGIPQTVIIGKDGNVAAVHIGFSPALKTELTAEIEKLLGK